MSVVETYLAAIATQDWETAEACLAPDVVRTGPFGDVYKGRGPYLQFLRDLMPKLAGYEMRVDRVVAGADGRVVVAELAETVELDGDALATPECLVFDLDPAGQIVRIAIYIQREPAK